MRHFFVLFAVLTALLIAAPVAAQAQETLQQTHPEESAPALRIESDAERNAFIFIIDEEEVARLDKSGFYVRDSIVFGGTLTDTGSGWVDDYIVDGKTGAQDTGGNDEQ